MFLRSVPRPKILGTLGVDVCAFQIRSGVALKLVQCVPSVTRLGEAGFDAFTIASLMGHSDVRTTQRYVRATELNKRAAVQAAASCSPWPQFSHKGTEGRNGCYCKCLKRIGGAEGDRTPDLMTASHALSQLSYGPN